MGRKASTINLSEDERLYLETQMRARTIQAQTVIRARILLLKAEGISVDHIADKVGMNRKSVMLCINKYLEGGVENALFDAPGRGRNAEITDDEKAWIINIACQKPVNLGYSAEVWTRALLTKHINKFAEEAGHTRLSTISQSKVRTILEEADIKPNKITYYCENRDPDFDQKMHNVLLVYKQLSLQFDEKGQLIPFKEDEQVVHVLSYDEKPGIQAIANTTEDLLPDENHKTVSRDYEYKRLGTISLLAGIDLQTGEAIPLVKDKHSSKEYIEFLKILDSKYPETDRIRLVLDNLKVHSSEETRKYLATKPGRFEFVFTPWELQKQKIKEGNPDAIDLEAQDGTANPDYYLLRTSAIKDEFGDEANFIEPKGNFNFNAGGKMVFQFVMDHSLAGGYTRVQVEYAKK